MAVIEIAQIGADIVRKALDLHKRGIDTDALRVVHETLKVLHGIVDDHHKKHQKPVDGN
ncbi:MAG: hypothetical protein OXU23_18360 [Candidatus Poribacteria bacterium]|nr:hypothetical protein [Candidatus Poribacteria bacterium]